MKKLSLWKIDIPIWSILYFVLLSLCGLFNSCFFLFLLISIHEGAHCLCAILFKMKVEKITVTPFGMQASIQNMGFYPGWIEIPVILAGPFTHLIDPILFEALNEFGIISVAMMQWLFVINRSMILVNMLPIYPLDGGRLVNEILHFFFPYTQSEKLTVLLSALNLLILFISNEMNTAFGIIVIGFIACCLIKTMRDLPIIKRMFYLFRLHHPIKTRKIRTCKGDIYKNFQTKVLEADEIEDEREWLSQVFNENSQQTLQKNLPIVL